MEAIIVICPRCQKALHKGKFVELGIVETRTICILQGNEFFRNKIPIKLIDALCPVCRSQIGDMTTEQFLTAKFKEDEIKKDEI